MKAITYVLTMLMSLFMTGCQAQAPAAPAVQPAQPAAAVAVPSAQPVTAVAAPSAQPNTAVTETVVFWNSMGCTDQDCADPTHYHHCAAGCADPSHYHDCPAGCADTTHGHDCPTGNAGTGHHWEGGHHSGHHG